MIDGPPKTIFHFKAEKKNANRNYAVSGNNGKYLAYSQDNLKENLCRGLDIKSDLNLKLFVLLKCNSILYCHINS